MARSKVHWLSVSMLSLILLVLGALAGCSEQGVDGSVRQDALAEPIMSLAMSPEGRFPPDSVSAELYNATEADRDTMAGSPPCVGVTEISCVPRDASRFNLFTMIQAGADQYDLALPQTAKTSFKVLAQGGLSPFRHAMVNF